MGRKNKTAFQARNPFCAQPIGTKPLKVIPPEEYKGSDRALSASSYGSSDG